MLLVTVSVKLVGSWMKVFTQTTSSIVRLMEHLITEWSTKFTPTSAASANINDLRAMRHVKDLKEIALLATVSENWLRPLAKQDFGDEGVAVCDRLWKSGALTAELLMIVEARGRAELFDSIKLGSMPQLYSLLCARNNICVTTSDRILKAKQMTEAWERKVKEIMADEDVRFAFQARFTSQSRVCVCMYVSIVHGPYCFNAMVLLLSANSMLRKTSVPCDLLADPPAASCH